MKKALQQTSIILSILLIGQLMMAQTGKYDVTGNLSMGSSHTYEAQIKNTSGAGTGNDQIDATGDATIDGTLDIVLDGYTVNNADQFEIIAYGGTQSGTFSTINWPASMSSAGWMIDYGTLNAGKVTIYGPMSALPVEWLSVKVISTGTDHILRWATASEINSDYYIVEHSADGQEFSIMDKINSQGTSFDLQNYSYTHLSPNRGTHYYRLRQVDKDGKEEYSKVVSIRKDELSNISYYPNPVSEVLHFNQKVSLIVLYNINGQEVKRAENITDIDVSDLQNGTYILDVNNGTIRKNIIINK